jgi:hypothetical protein
MRVYGVQRSSRLLTPASTGLGPDGGITANVRYYGAYRWMAVKGRGKVVVHDCLWVLNATFVHVMLTLRPLASCFA